MAYELSDRKLLGAILKADFFSFFQRAFSIVEAGTPLDRAYYLEAICHRLQTVSNGKIKRLIINVPPRHLKSVITSIIWVAWELSRDPSKKIAIVCHNDMLAGDLALKCKRLIESEWYRLFAPTVRISADRDRTKDFETTAQGGVYLSSIESGITGRGFDIIILDDPQAAKDATSEAERNRVTRIFDEALSSRLNNPIDGRIVLVQQRLHEDDLSGRLIERGNWDRLSLPLVALEPTSYPIYASEWLRQAGEVLCQLRIPAEKVGDLRVEKGSRVFETQYQQSPSSFSGEIIKPECLRSISSLPPSAKRFFVSVDTATKALATSDYTVFLVIATDGHRHYVVDAIRGQFEVTQMRDIALGIFSRYAIEGFLIEDSASGSSLQSILREASRQTKLVGTGGKAKETRLEACLHFFEEQRVFLVGDAPWISAFRDEVVRFPIAKYDDQVDALILYLLHFIDRKPVNPIVLGAGGCIEARFPSARKLRKGEHELRPRRRR